MSGGGGGAIRNRSGERRWDSSPYSDRNYYSSSLVTTYLSPPPESRWRRTSSDSALYQKLTQPTSPNQKSPSEQGSPEYSPAGDDVKPAPELLETLLWWWVETSVTRSVADLSESWTALLYSSASCLVTALRTRWWVSFLLSLSMILPPSSTGCSL